MARGEVLELSIWRDCKHECVEGLCLFVRIDDGVNQADELLVCRFGMQEEEGGRHRSIWRGRLR
jgi:hypothetical protein